MTDIDGGATSATAEEGTNTYNAAQGGINTEVSMQTSGHASAEASGGELAEEGDDHAEAHEPEGAGAPAVEAEGSATDTTAAAACADAPAEDSTQPAGAGAHSPAAGSRQGSRPGSKPPSRPASGASQAAAAPIEPSKQGLAAPGPERSGVSSAGSATRPTSARPMSAASTGRLGSGFRAPTLPPPLPPTAEAEADARAEGGAPAPLVAPTTDAPPKLTEYHHEHLRAIDVEVYQGPGLPYKMVPVLLDSSELVRKPYLGGYKSKRSNAVYHHACTQTPKAKKFEGVERKLERTTQTVIVKPAVGQTVREAATQMERAGVLLDTTYDVEHVPGRYQTSEERLAIVAAATCVLQRHWRGTLARRRATQLRRHRDEREAFLVAEEAKARVAAEEHRRKEIERRMHPRTAADFEILYNELEAWRLQETSKIKGAGLAKDKEQEVLQQLLHKETKLLQTIDRLKINANYENKDLRVQKTLTEMGKPKAFDLKNGATVEVHTPYTTRAMELTQLYNGLNLLQLTIDERLDVLLHVKWTVKEFDCKLTREIVELIDREADMLNRGRPPSMLEGLRKRISSLFLTFVETPEFNPESARFQIVPMDFEAYLFDRCSKATARPALVKT
ncbi:hypothetical protein FOA52_009605 [Chlamydomonas sp. UWO 241]|nr:hypothetical protein FOA52_009605 [Chlamydomonas sp. UWO 241]